MKYQFYLLIIMIIFGHTYKASHQKNRYIKVEECDLPGCLGTGEEERKKYFRMLQVPKKAINSGLDSPKNLSCTGSYKGSVHGETSYLRVRSAENSALDADRKEKSHLFVERIAKNPFSLGGNDDANALISCNISVSKSTETDIVVKKTVATQTDVVVTNESQSANNISKSQSEKNFNNDRFVKGTVTESKKEFCCC